MDIEQVETFLAVIAVGSFHGAARLLRVTQPAVTARIKSLETSLGARVFERDRDGLRLSPAGRALRPHAEELVQLVARARQTVQRLTPASGGPLKIAAVPTVSTYLLPPALKRFRASHPGVPVTIRSGMSEDVLAMVLAGDTELGIARSLFHSAVETSSLANDPLVLVQARDHPLVRPARARLAQIADRPLIFFVRGTTAWTLAHALFRRAGLVPNVVLEVETIEAGKRMVEEGLGLAFLPHLAVARELRLRTLVGIDLIDAEPLNRSLDVIRQRQRPLSLEAAAFIEALRPALHQLAPGSSPGPGRSSRA